MIEAIIRWSVGNRFFVLLATAILVGAGVFAVRQTPVDAIPDLSDVQVIIKGIGHTGSSGVQVLVLASIQHAQSNSGVAGVEFAFEQLVRMPEQDGPAVFPQDVR